MLEVIARLTTTVLRQQRTLCNIIASFLEGRSGQLRGAGALDQSELCTSGGPSARGRAKCHFRG